MKDFVDYQDLCYGLKKVFAEDFNKNLLPQVTSDPNLKLEPENVNLLVILLRRILKLLLL